MKCEYPSAIPASEPEYPRIKLYEIHEMITAFEDRDRAIVSHFRRSKKLKLRGQVKFDV